MVCRSSCTTTSSPTLVELHQPSLTATISLFPPLFSITLHLAFALAPLILESVLKAMNCVLKDPLHTDSIRIVARRENPEQEEQGGGSGAVRVEGASRESECRFAGYETEYTWLRWREGR